MHTIMYTHTLRMIRPYEVLVQHGESMRLCHVQQEIGIIKEMDMHV